MLAVILFITLLRCCNAVPSVTLSLSNGNSSPYLAAQHETVTLNCAATGFTAGIDRYEWVFKNTVLSSGFKPIEREYSSSLIIDSVAYLQHLGDYYCRVTSSDGVYQSNVCSMQARFAAIFPVRNVDTVYVVNNGTAVLQCIEVLPPHETSATIAWRKVSSGVIMSDYAPGNNILQIHQATVEDDGEYRCHLLTAISGSEDADIRLVVITLPEFFYFAMNLTLNVHESGTLQCGLVQTESPVNFTWHLNGRPLPFNNRLSVSSDLKTKRSTLQLSDVTYAESGNYECIASNSAGSVRQLHVVTVLGAPVITLPSNSTSLRVPVTQNVKVLDCPYLANPLPVVQWLKSNQALGQDASKHRVFNNGSLLISDLAIEDSGNYMCITSNSFGVDEATYNLLVINLPATPEGLQVMFVDDDPRSVVLSWSPPAVDINRPLEGFLIQYSIEGGTPQEIEQDIQNYHTEITSLFPGEAYQVSLQAFNTVGESEPLLIDFTLPVSAPSMIFNVSVLSDGYSLLAQWQLLYDGGPSIDVFTIKVFQVATIQLLTYTVDAEITDGSQVLSGLDPITEYLLEVFVSNGQEDEVMTFPVTTSAAPPGQPSTPKVTLTTTHIFEITFTVSEGSQPINSILLNTSQALSGGRSSIQQTLIDVNDQLYVDSIKEISAGEKEVVLVIGGLQQLQQYSFQVAVISDVGQGEFSEPSTPSTLARVLYFIIFGVVGGALFVIVIIIVVAMAMLRTTRQIQRTKRTLSINNGASKKGIPESFVLQSPPAGRRRPSLQLTNLNDYSSSHCDTPLSSVSNYKHHMLSSSTGEAAPIYDRLSDLQIVVDSVSSEGEKRNGSVSSDGAEEEVQESFSDSAARLSQPVEKVIVDMYSSEGRIDSVSHDFGSGNGASANPSPPCLRPPYLHPPYLHSSAGQLQVKSTHSLSQPRQQQILRQNLPSSLHQLPLLNNHKVTPPQHLLCPPTFVAGSSPAINCRASCDSMLEGYKPTSYMTDV